MRIYLLLIASTFLFSCIEENELHDVFPINLLNANSSKVWVLSESNDPNEDVVPLVKEYRKCIIFYENNSFREQDLIYLGSNKGAIGKYTIDEDDNGEYILILYYPNQNQEPIQFQIQKIGNTQLVLQKENDKGNLTIWVFQTLNPPY